MAIGDFYNANDVVVGQAAVVFAPKDTALPALSSWTAGSPFDLTFWQNGDPNWTPCGATDQGWQFGADKSTQEIRIEEQSTPVARTITDQSITLSAALSEDVTQTLELAYNAVSTHTTGPPAYDDIQLSDVPIEYAVGLVTVSASGKGRIIYAPSWVQLSNPSVSFRRASDKRSYEAQFSTTCEIAKIRIINFVS